MDMITKKGRSKKANWILAICVAVTYLAVSILFDSWEISWIIWVCYCLFRVIWK